MDCWEGLKSLPLWRSFKQGQIVHLTCLGCFKIKAEGRLMVQTAPWQLPPSQALSESVTLYITHHSSLICWVWRTPFYLRIEKGNIISQLWVLSKSLIMLWWNIMSSLLFFFFLTRQATCKWLSIRNRSHESKFWTAVPLNVCSQANKWHMPFLKQNIKSPNKS